MFDFESILRCPMCGGKIAKELYCEGCGAVYAKKHGVYKLISLARSGDQDFLWKGEIPEDEASLFPPSEEERYRVIGEDYARHKNRETKEAQAKQLAELKRQLKEATGVICDFATGGGSMLQWILDYATSAEAVVCTDINEYEMMVTRARRCKERNNVHFLATDGRYLALADNSVDVITSLAGFGNVPDAEMAAAELFRILKPGGRIILDGEFIDAGTKSHELAKSVGLERGLIEEYLLADLRAAGFINIRANVIAEAVWDDNPYDLIPAAGDSQRFYILTAEKPTTKRRLSKNETMGQIIKRLRKERGFTQEELAEQLNVTFQAISKWENDAGMPDISQVVPLAHVFGVSTDVLFGTQARDDDEEAAKIIHRAMDATGSPATKEGLLNAYTILKEGLSDYPTNALLLRQCLETGIALAYPENGTLYDRATGEKIYRECIRFADLVLKYGDAPTETQLRAHMIMVLLHAAYGNEETAKEHAKEFPWRADMIAHQMDAYIAHWHGDSSGECRAMQNAFMMHLEAVLDDMVGIAQAYTTLEKYTSAEATLEDAVALMDAVCQHEAVRPALHHRERGDIYALLAQVRLKLGKTEAALEALTTMVEHDTTESSVWNTPKSVLRDLSTDFYFPKKRSRSQTLDKLKTFAELEENAEFKSIVERLNK